MAWRIVFAIGALMTLLLTGLVVQNQLQILAFASGASAVQITQVHAEAQTVLLGGIMVLLTIIAFGVLLPRPPAQPKVIEPSKPIPVVPPQSSSSSESS